MEMDADHIKEKRKMTLTLVQKNSAKGWAYAVLNYSQDKVNWWGWLPTLITEYSLFVRGPFKSKSQMEEKSLCWLHCTAVDSMDYYFIRSRSNHG